MVQTVKGKNKTHNIQYVTFTNAVLGYHVTIIKLTLGKKT